MMAAFVVVLCFVFILLNLVFQGTEPPEGQLMSLPILGTMLRASWSVSSSTPF